MKYKQCCKCKKFKPLNEFYKNHKNKDGLQYVCKTCKSKKDIDYIRTKNGLIIKMYSAQKTRVKLKRLKISYTIEELKKWILKQPNFDKLFNEWIKSGYEKMLIPSIDRLNDYKGYSFDNIQLMTWQENKTKYCENAKNGINNKMARVVLQYDLNGNFIKEYYSAKNASIENNINYSNIINCCLGKRKTARKYKWEYKNGK